MTTSLDAVFGDEGKPASASEEVKTENVNTDNPAPESGQPRDDKGKFASKAEVKTEQPGEKPKEEDGKDDTPKETVKEPAPEAKAEGEGEGGKVPHKALHAARMRAHEERQRREALERELAALRAGQQPVQQPAQAPVKPMSQEERIAAFLADPDAFLEAEIQKRIQPLQQTLTAQQERQSEMWAVRDHGAETVEEAKLAAMDLQEQGGPAFDLLVTRLKASPHPFDELVKWHKEQSILQRSGGDLDKYIEAEIARRMQAQGSVQQQPPAAQKPGTPMPTSFASARSSGPRGGAGYGGPRPLTEIFKS